jgi:hypothetical protein
MITSSLRLRRGIGFYCTVSTWERGFQMTPRMGTPIEAYRLGLGLVPGLSYRTRYRGGWFTFRPRGGGK